MSISPLSSPFLSFKPEDSTEIVSYHVLAAWCFANVPRLANSGVTKQQ